MREQELLIILVIVGIVFLISRELVCWYWKINEGLNILRKIDQKLSSLAEISLSGKDFLPQTGKCPKCSRVWNLEMNERVLSSFSCPKCDTLIFKAHVGFQGGKNVIE